MTRLANPYAISGEASPVKRGSRRVVHALVLGVAAVGVSTSGGIAAAEVPGAVGVEPATEQVPVDPGATRCETRGCADEGVTLTLEEAWVIRDAKDYEYYLTGRDATDQYYYDLQVEAQNYIDYFGG